MNGTAWFDGACSGNPGPMGAGAVLQIGAEQRSFSLAKGRGTNNEAEYHAVILALRQAHAAGIENLVLKGDSQLILRQLEGRYKVSAANLVALHAEAKALLGKFKSARLEWIPRAQNEGADAAARAAIGAK